MRRNILDAHVTRAPNNPCHVMASSTWTPCGFPPLRVETWHQAILLSMPCGVLTGSLTVLGHIEALGEPRKSDLPSPIVPVRHDVGPRLLPIHVAGYLGGWNSCSSYISITHLGFPYIRTNPWPVSRTRILFSPFSSIAFRLRSSF